MTHGGSADMNAADENEEVVLQTVTAPGVLLITLNRPEERNAINSAAAIAIAEAMDRLDSDPDIVVGVIAGAGGNFCAGMDLKAFLAGERPLVPGRGFAGLVESPPQKPLIAAVEGYALAGGFEIALACDLIVAAQDARFGLPEVRRGLLAAGGGLMRLPQRIPYHLAMECALTGNILTAQRADAAGLINKLTPAGTAVQAAVDMAREIASNGPLAVRGTKKIIVETADWTRAEMFDRQREISVPIRESADAQEGARAFTEKRTPRWQGR